MTLIVFVYCFQAGATGITVTDGDDNIAAMAAAAACNEDSDNQPLIKAPTVDTCAPFTDYNYSYASSVTSKSESGNLTSGTFLFKLYWWLRSK